MKLLLDTHTLLWWWLDDPRLSRKAYALIREADNKIFASAVSALEIATRVRIGKLPEAGELVHRFESGLSAQGFQPLPVTVEHGLRAGLLAGKLGDPFDRILSAQSLIENLTLISNDKSFDEFGVARVW